MARPSDSACVRRNAGSRTRRWMQADGNRQLDGRVYGNEFSAYPLTLTARPAPMALRLGSELGAFLTYDAQQATAARAAGLSVEMPGASQA